MPCLYSKDLGKLIEILESFFKCLALTFIESNAVHSYLSVKYEKVENMEKKKIANCRIF